MVEIFAITPASSKPVWIIFAVCALLLVLVLVLIFVAYASQHSRIEVHADSIKIVGDFWGRKIPLDAINVHEAKFINLELDQDYRPKWRTFGTGLMGYASGWFRLYNGEKALVYLTDKRNVVYVPTTLGYSLLLSVSEPDHFLTALRAR